MRKKPLIIFDNSNDPRGKSKTNNIRQQNLLLKGILLTSNFLDAGKYAGIKRTVDIYRTWDRLTLRKDFQQALAEEGVDMTFIVRGIKNQAETAALDSVRLEAYKTLLRSMGLERYTKDEETSAGWEDALVGYVNKQEGLPMPKSPGYEVKLPEVPDSARRSREEDNVLGKELYESS